jgi:hypothetical protein
LFDIDGDATFGCEATCEGKVCTDKGGNRIELTSLPVPEGGNKPLGTSSGASWGATTGGSASYVNVGILGESPGPAAGAADQQSATYKNRGGFRPALRNK